MYATGALTLNTVLDHRTEHDGGRTFLIIEYADGTWEELTYAAFAKRVDAAAGELADLGVEAGDRVALFLSNRPEFLAYLAGCMRLGAVAVPTITLSAVDELRYVLEHSGAVALITERSLLVTAAAAAGGVGRRICVDPDGDLPAGWRPAAPAGTAVPTRPDRSVAGELGLLMYSSGTTARPKGIMISHGALLHAAEANAAHQRLQPGDRHLCMTPLFHANALCISTLSTLVTGSSEVLLQRFDETRYWAQARTYRASAGSLVAAAIKRLLAQPEDPGDGEHALRFVLYGLPLQPAEIEEFERRFRVPLVNMWGMTENIATGTRSPIHLPRRPETIGLPMLGMQLVVRDEQGHPVAPGDPGEAWFRGGATTTGYFRDPDATAAAAQDGWLRTGDVMSMDEQGYLTFVDRRKDVIKVRGENVASSEVERVLLEHPDVGEAAVIGMPDPVRDERIVAFLVARPGRTLDPADVTEHCRRLVARFKVPHEIHVVDGLPKTSIQKVRKAELRTMLVESRENR